MTTQDAAGVALAGFALFAFVAFGIRGWMHYRRTGTTGFIGISGRPGSAEWAAGVGFIAAIVTAVAGPILQLAGAVAPLPAFAASWVAVAGIAIYAAGVAATFWAQVAMGNSWRVGVDPAARTELVAGGPFRWVRNPIYTAMTITAAGLALLAPNVVSLFGLIALIVALELQVRLVEEPYLARVHGAQYRRYAAQTGRFVPAFGRLAGNGAH